MLTNLVQKSSKSRWKSLQLFYPRWKHTFDSVDSETASFPGLVLSSASAVRSKSCLNKSAIENHKDRGSTTQCQFIQQNSPLLRFFFFPSVFGETCDYNHLNLCILMSFLACCAHSAPQCQTPKVLAQSLSPPLRQSDRVRSSQVSSGFTRAGTPRNWRKKWPKARPATWPRMPRASWITQPKMGLEQAERKKKNDKSNMNESDSVVKWWNPILNCTSFNQCMGMKSTAFTPQALMISVRTETWSG